MTSAKHLSSSSLELDEALSLQKKVVSLLYSPVLKVVSFFALIMGYLGSCMAAQREK